MRVSRGGVVIRVSRCRYLVRIVCCVRGAEGPELAVKSMFQLVSG